MPSLVPTLAAQLAQADRALAEGRLPAARRAYEDLVERAQERADRATEVAARAMLARCLLQVQQREAARDQLASAGRVVDPRHAAYGRYRAALARLALEDGPEEPARAEVRSYLQWAEEDGRVDAIVDAGTLLARAVDPHERADRLDRAIERCREVDAQADLGPLWVELASALDQVGATEPALEAWQRALDAHRERGRGRPTVAAGWALGVAAVRLEDWPLARAVLEDAIRDAAPLPGCEDLAALATADLALVYEAAGDVVEARHLVLRALARGRDLQLASVWPSRWSQLRDQAVRLELEAG